MTLNSVSCSTINVSFLKELSIVSGYKNYTKKESYTDSKSIFISELRKGLRLNNLLKVKYTLKGGYWCIHFVRGDLLIEVMEESYLDMVDDFKNELADYWDYLAHEDDDNLTAGANHVKQWLRKNITEVPI